MTDSIKYELYVLANKFLSLPVQSHEALFVANELAEKTGRPAYRAGYWTARNLAEGIVRKYNKQTREEIGNVLAEEQIREETDDSEGWISGPGTKNEKPECVGDVMYVTYDKSLDVYDVVQKIRGKMDPKGFVYEDMDGTWAASRHTYTGIPADNGDGYESRDDAILSLKDASPFRDEQKRQESFADARQEMARRIRKER